jgi:hypothetical protein
MYLDALSFLDDERDAWRPFEALLDLDDSALVHAVDTAHGWSARDLMGHLVAWQEVALAIAKELAVGEQSPTIARVDRDWEERGGEVVNAELQREWAALPLDEVRRRFSTVAGELRGYLTVVPEARWVKHPVHLRTFLDETIEHYAEHQADLEAILAAAGRP